MAKVKHIALVKFKDDTTEEQRDKVFDSLLDVTEEVPGIEDFVWGPNNSPESLNDAYTHGFIITFTDSAARDAYLTHPEHERFKAEALPSVDKVLVLDFEV